MAIKNIENLETYRAKRKASQTPEPFGGVRMGGQRFVVQQHAARRRHYDFRLELDGVLKSWAVPKGPSPNPADKRLAVHVEDHPLEYANFEGLIPSGNYGAGAVIVWDRGRWVPLNDPAEGLKVGKLLFELRGYKLRGRWTLVKTRRGANEWLLIKERDVYADQRSTDDYPADSILSGQTVDEIGAGKDPQGPLAARLIELGANAACGRSEPAASDARDAGQAVLGSAVGLRAQVRRLPIVRRKERGAHDTVLAGGQRSDGHVSGSGGDCRSPAVFRFHHRRRGRRARRARVFRASGACRSAAA